jgi:anti-anti-sigma factor
MSTLEAQPTLVAKPPPRARSQAALHDPESAALWHHHLDIETGPAGSIAVLHMAGDIDMLTLPLVCAALITALNTRPADLVVDLSEVHFCGVRGFGLLAAMARTTTTCGIGYAVAGMGPHLDRAATQAWSDQRLRRHANTAAAVTATRRGQARLRADHQ